MTPDTDDELIASVLTLATGDSDLPEDAKYLVLAALDGDAALSGALGGGQRRASGPGTGRCDP